jgi:hypothetical protein
MIDLKVTFGKAESYHQGWKGKTTRIDIRQGKEVVGEIIGRENAGIAGAMFWRVELKGQRGEEVASMKAAKVKARELLFPAALMERP